MDPGTRGASSAPSGPDGDAVETDGNSRPAGQTLSRPFLSLFLSWAQIVLLCLLTTFFATFCLLSIATSASAGTGWLLWSQDVATEPGLVTDDKKAWRRIAAFDRKAACFSDASTKAEELAYGADEERKLEVLRLVLGDDHLAVKSTFRGGLFDGARMWTYYRCLPDTVDPRGPKGK